MCLATESKPESAFLNPPPNAPAEIEMGASGAERNDAQQNGIARPLKMKTLPDMNPKKYAKTYKLTLNKVTGC